jgi:cytochrome c553/chitodextrinase
MHQKSVQRAGVPGLLRRIIFNGLFSIALFLTSANANPVVVQPDSHAFAVREPSSVLDKITPLHAIHLQALDSTASLGKAVQAALDATTLMPPGRRAILNVDLDFLAIANAGVATTSADSKTMQVMTANGSLLPEHGIWLEQGVATVRQRVSDFFRLYRQAGGELDLVALDYRGLSLTAADLQAVAEASGSLPDYLAAIEADPRFAEVKAQLGFGNLLSLYAGDTRAAKRQQRWNAVMKQRMAAYLQQAFYQPLAAVFPQVQVTARDYYRQTADFSVPGNAFEQTSGALAGNAQGRHLSGVLPAGGLQIAGKAYAPTAFNAFRYETNRVRGMVLSAPEAVFPTLNAKNQPETTPGMAALLQGSDLYQEMVIHAALAGARQFVYQNQNAPADDETLLDNTLKEVDQYLGATVMTPAIDNLVDWQQPFVLSGATGAKGKVWRFTPRLDAYTSIASTISQQQPAVFHVGGMQITVPGAKVEAPATAVSGQGLWLTGYNNTGVAGCPLPLAENRECVAYYSGDSVSGQAALFVEKTAQALDTTSAVSIMFARDWKSGGPDAGVGRDHFTAQYNATYDFPAGTYQFTVKADDAVKLWLDGQLLLDGSVTQTTATRTLTEGLPLSGTHTLKLEYTDLAGAAAVELGVQHLAAMAAADLVDDCSVVPVGEFCGQFFANKTLEGQPAAIQHTPAIDFDWGTGKPLDNLPANDFSARWVGDFNFQAGNYTFATSTDDGVRMWLDDELLVDAWKDQAPTSYRKSTQVAAGKHRIKMEYYEHTSDAVARLSWAKNTGCKAIPSGQFCAEYYNNTELTDNPVKIRNEPAINYDWKDGSPLAGVNADNFSVRWQGDFALSGDYRLVAQADDRMRVWVDGNLLINAWDSNDGKEQFKDVSLSAGKHRIRMEMREYRGMAKAKLFWEQRSDCQGIPNNAFCGSFFAGDTLTGDVVRTQKTTALDFNWGTDRPMQGVPSDMFSARWQGKFNFPTTGYYRFSGEMDDGVKVWVDDQPVVDQWSSDSRFPAKTQSVPFIEAGKHTVKVEYRERYGTAYLKLGWQLVDGCGTTPENAFCMAFFDSKDLSGLPKQVLKTAPGIDYAWGDAQPDPMVWKDNFSVRWTGKVWFDASNYRFITDLDEGARIWVDGELLLDVWNRTWPYYGKYRTLKTMSAGLHDIKVEYFEAGGTANARVFWEKAPDCSAVPQGKFCATFYEGKDFTTAPIDTRIDDAINFNWGKGALVSDYLSDNVAIRWVGDFDFEEGQHTFTTTVDDGVRVWLDDALLIDAWKNQNASYKKALYVTPGKHRVRMEYYEATSNAVAQLTWAKNTGCTTIPTGAYCAEYYDNNSLTDDPVKIQDDPAINFDWKDGIPVAGVKADNFSVRWQGDFNLAGDYRFIAQADDTLRVWVDGELLLDATAAGKEVFKDATLVAGKHRIKVEMRESGGWASAKFFWEERHECSGIPDNTFCGSFFNGGALEGDAVRTQETPSINFDWGANRPMHGVNTDLFAARWLGRFNFNAGYYRFTGDVDDGVRVWLDDVLLIDQWSQDWQWQGKVQAVPYITKGSHVVKVEYRENYGNAKAKLGWEEVNGCATTPRNLFCMELYNNKDLSGFARQVLKTDAINFDWLTDAPDPMVSKDSFSARWTGNIHFDDGLYRFLTEADDGARIWVDNEELLIDAWTTKEPQRRLKTMTAGWHNVKVEYHENSGTAKAKVWWEKAPDCSTEMPQGKFCTSFYNTRDLTGEVADTRYDDAINFDWAGNAPQNGVNADNFSARWQGQFDFAEGEYTFTSRSDDGFRLWVDGQNLIDAWKNQPATTYSKRIFLTSGNHTVKAEYYDATSTAVAQLGWKAEQLSEPQVPANLRTTVLAQDKVTLAWDAQALVTQYKVYKGTRLLARVDTTNATDTAVQPTQTYTYTVTAVWPNGKESRPALLNVTVPDTEAPSAPGKLAVKAMTPVSVTLAWNPASDNIGVKTYQIWRNNVLIGESSSTGFVDASLTSAGKYSYKVKAVDTSGNISPASAALSVTTKDGTGPTTPTGVVAEVLAPTRIALSWEAATDNVGVTGYRILRNGVLAGTSTQLTFTDSKVQQGTLYQYQIVARDAAGNISAPSTAVDVTSGDATAPGMPPNLTAQVTTDQQVRLQWDAAIDNKGVVKYRLMRNGRLLGMTDRLVYTDETVKTGQSYTYTVKAEDAAGNISLDSLPVTLSVDGICDSSQLYYQQHVEGLMGNCTTCHVAGGMGQNTRFILSTSPDATARNLGAINGITQLLGKQAVLNKVSGGLTHGGGTVFGKTSSEYSLLANLLGQLATPGQCSTVIDPNEPVLTESMAANCANCHGTAGTSAGPATPGIGGMSKQYLEKVMSGYQDGSRAATVMGRIAKGFSADELSRLSGFFSQQPYVTANQTTDTRLVTRGKALHEQYCASCHTASGRDASLTGTRLAGQWKPYLQATLKDYARERSQASAGMLEKMRSLYSAEGDDGIAALAEFYASNAHDTQPPTQAEDLDAVSYSPTSVTLTWTDASDDWGILRYDIYRDGVWIGQTRFNAFTDMGLKAGKYSYTVVAVDIFGNKSVVSKTASAVLTSDEIAPDGVQLLNYPDTLRKASLLLLNRLPLQTELDAAKTEDAFRLTLRQMMDSKGALDPFVYRAGHEVFLNSGAAGIGSGAGLAESDFPALKTLSTDEKNAANDAVRKEPVFLLQYLVANDKPWTDALTASYTVMNPQLAKATGAKPVSGNFSNPADAKELRPVRIPQISARYPGKAFAHAGVLSSNAWLSRFPTTDTNRNRHRAARVYKQFMALDIEALAQRPLDDSKNGNYLVPTMQNPNCMVCHTIMEPVAGAFRDWGVNSHFWQNFDGVNGSKDSLASVYKSGSYPLDQNGQPWYHTGDTWYRDMFPAGFNNTTAPGGYSAFGGKTWTSSANLLTSPSAEQGTKGWTVGKGVLEAANPSTCSRIPRTSRTGTYLYQLGSCNTPVDETLAWQDVNISASAKPVDQGKAEMDFGAYFSSLGGQDTPSVWVEYLNAANQSLGKSAVLTDKTSWTWTNKSSTQTVPKLTRKLRFTVQGLRSTLSWADKYTDAYVDDLFLVLRTPDSNALTVPAAKDSLQWLGSQLVQDPRFAKGGVYFWYKPLFKRDPLKAPVDPAAAGYAVQMAAYNAQDEILEQFAKRFAYDQGHGAWNVKDLLIDMVASPLFRAKAGNLSAEQAAALPDTGLARLLTPEELNAKIKSLTGTDWYSFRPENAWGSSMGLFYGGFDGGRLQSKPNTDMNSLMNNIPERMAIELSCNAVGDDFRLAAGSRKLFPFVEPGDTPVYEEIDTSTLNLLVNPGAEAGMDGWNIEQGTARILSGKAGTCDGGPSIKSGTAIFNPGSICSNPTPLGLLYQSVDVNAWDEAIDTGQSKVLFGAALRGWGTDNDEASVYLSFRDRNDNELGTSQILSGKEGYWKTELSYAPVPAQTRSIRFYMQGKRIDTSTNPNNDSFVDDTYLRVVTPDDNYMPAGEKRVRANLQYLYRQFLNEKLALDDPDITRAFKLFSDVWANRSDSGDAACRLYSSWEDPTYTKRAWGVVMMYLMNDARFLHE